MAQMSVKILRPAFTEGRTHLIKVSFEQRCIRTKDTLEQLEILHRYTEAQLV
jgi:hypothetical protein